RRSRSPTVSRSRSLPPVVLLRSRTSRRCWRRAPGSWRARSRAARSMTAGSIRLWRWRGSAAPARRLGFCLAPFFTGTGTQFVWKRRWEMPMFKVRVIPCLDVKDGRVVKGVNFVDLRDAGDPVEAAIAYDAAGADELCFLDITATHENRGIILDVVRR